MSAQSRNRTLALAAAVALLATSLFAAYPSSRTEARMVYDRVSTNVILYGGLTPPDTGTKQSYSLNETWAWNGFRWTRLFPAHDPGPRSSFSFVYDTARNRAVFFGGEAGPLAKDQFNDTWIYQNGDWAKLDTPNAPGVRYLQGAAYDPIRDRVVLFGGSQRSADNKSVTTLADTWEFDGTTWVQRATTGPAVIKPVLVYDAARNEVLMVGLDEKTATLMYRYKPDSATWEVINPATRPSCVNEAVMAYQPTNQTVVLTGGVCTGSGIQEETYEWNGTDWTKIDAKSHSGNAFGAALAFDELRGVIVQYGGTQAFADPQNSTYLYRDGNWTQWRDPFAPGPRSLFAFRGDPENKAMWLINGFNDLESFAEMWQYRNGVWSKITATGGPESTCFTPTAAYDTARKQLVVVCSDSTTYEWNGQAWKKFELTEKQRPTARRFSSMVYDENINKTVLFGGFNDPNYFDQTWTWDGTTWTQIKKNLPPSRALTSMWYDPIKKRTMIFGGIGRQEQLDRIKRYNDMWQFDGTSWAEVKPTATPGTRYGAQVATDPASGKTYLFGGLKVEQSGTLQTQVYANDTWEWDGTNWRKLETGATPPARENGFFDFDPSTGKLTLFGGYSGFYHADVWRFSDGAWTFVTEPPLLRRRSSAH